MSQVRVGDQEREDFLPVDFRLPRRTRVGVFFVRGGNSQPDMPASFSRRRRRSSVVQSASSAIARETAFPFASKQPVPFNVQNTPAPDPKTQFPDLTHSLSSPDHPELVMNSYSKPVVTRSMKGSTGWVHSPAMFRVLTLTQRDLVKVAQARGMKATRFQDIKYVRAGRRKGTMEIYVWPTTAEDGDRIEIQHGKKNVWINLISLLSAEQMTLEPGVRERYVVKVVGEESPAKDALMFDMALPTARRISGKAKASGDDA